LFCYNSKILSDVFGEASDMPEFNVHISGNLKKKKNQKKTETRPIDFKPKLLIFKSLNNYSIIINYLISLTTKQTQFYPSIYKLTLSYSSL